MLVILYYYYIRQTVCASLTKKGLSTSVYLFFANIKASLKTERGKLCELGIHLLLLHGNFYILLSIQLRLFLCLSPLCEVCDTLRQWQG